MEAFLFYDYMKRKDAYLINTCQGQAEYGTGLYVPTL